MYNLGDQFKIDYEKAKPNRNSVVAGEKYRITVLSERLVRIEYSENGIFEDRPTELIWYRNLETPKFSIEQNSKLLVITTSYFKLTYQKEKGLYGGKVTPSANLKIELLNSDREWYYRHPEVRNYSAPVGINSDGKIVATKGLYSEDGFVSIDDSNSKIISETGVFATRDNQETDIYVFMYLNDFAGCLKDYFTVTGRPALIPRYALGNWWSRNNDYKDIELKTLIDKFVQKEIPLSVLMLNNEWHYNSFNEVNNIQSGFTFNQEKFSAPFEMINYLHTKGIRVGLTVNPLEGIYPYEEHYQKVTQYFQANEKGIVPFYVYDPKVIDVYLKILIHPIDSLGIDFFNIDFPSSEELYILKHYQFYDMMRNYKRRPLILSRYQYFAPHRYPVLYAGETTVNWNSLKTMTEFNVMSTNNGTTWWAHDIGGFHYGIEDNELYIRYVQLGAFSPILKFGSDKGKYIKREPWRWSIKTYNIVKEYLQLRHRLIPYFYAEAYKYHNEGIPLINPLYYKYPEYYDDPVYKNEYFLGSELFVAPITTQKDYVMNRVVHKFFMPDGMWYDYVTGKKFPGGRPYVSFFKDQEYPVFARAGSIIVHGNNENINDTTPPTDLEIHIFPGRSNIYNLYEDDGISDLYRKGFYIKTQIDYNFLPNNYTVIVRAIEGKSGIIPEKRNYKFVFRNTKKTKDLIIYFNNRQYESISYVDGPNFIIEVKDVPTIGQLSVNCKGKDIEVDATRLVNEEIESIISDLQIDTAMKEKIDAIFFSEITVEKKRIEIRKLGNKGLEKKFVTLFLKLLEYLAEI